MKKQGRQFRVTAAGIGLALLLQMFAYAQEPVASPARAASTNTELPDSPGTVQARLNQPQAITPPAQPDNAQPAAEPTPSQQPEQPNGGTAVTPTSPQPGDQSPSPEPAPPAQATQEQPAQSSPQPQSPHEALGTAAAETVPTTGIAASRPTGAAVAPAKQRRVRSILIKVGALVGVGVAVGTTLALSQGSPSKPPGSN